MERTGPIPEPTKAGNIGVTSPVVEPARPAVMPVQTVVEMSPEEGPEVMVLGRSEDPEQVAPSTAPGAAGITPSSERAMVQHGGTPDFSRNEQEEEEVWKAQYEIGSQIQAALDRAFLLHKKTDFEISNVNALPRDSFVSDLIYVSSAYTVHPQRLRQISRDKSAELAQQYSKVQWLEQWNTNLIARLGEANTLVSDLWAQDRARKEELARAIEERDAQRAAA